MPWSPRRPPWPPEERGPSSTRRPPLTNMIWNTPNWPLLLLLLAYVRGFESGMEKRMGPVFISEPPSQVDFLNTTGASVDCLAYGNPSPRVRWRLRDGSLADNVPGLRQILPNGTLVLWPFRPEHYRQDVHADVYRCEAANVVGTVLSRDVHVRGVVKQYYEVQVYDEYVIRGNTAVLTCHVPSFVKDYVTVTSWIRDDVLTVASTMQEGGRYSVFPSGELHIRNVTPDDGSMSYRCQTSHRLTHEIIVSATSGRLIVTDSSGTVPPRVTDSRTALSAVQGDVVELPCAAQGFPVPRYSWYKYAGRNNSQLLPVYHDPRMTQLSGSLIIRQVNLEDGGKYVCLISNSAGEERTEMLLIVTDAAPVFHYVFTEETLQPGPFVSLKCVASGNPLPQITWTLDGSLLPEDQRFRVGDYITMQGRVVSYVNITSVRVEDGGEYECHARSSVGIVSHAARLNVYGLPYIRPMKDVSAVAGESLMLRCHVAGYPIDTITWHRGSSRLPINRRQEVFPNGTLIIQDVQRGVDDGTYKCKAWNKQGQNAFGTVRVHVMVRPVIDPFLFPKNLQEGMRSRLVCTVIQGDPPFVISWKKDDRPIEPGLGVIIRNDEFSSDLTFSSVTPRHNGNYTCIVSNAAASVSHTATLVVDVPPRWHVEPRDTSVVSGRNVRIDCLADGFPAPVITWERGSANSPRHYSAIASGPITSKVVFLTVHVPPRFDNKFRSETARKGDVVRLKCESTGDHPMTIVWNIDKQPLTPSEDPRRYDLKELVDKKRMSSEITIKSAERRDSALFTCLVRNAFGQDDMNIRLIVQEPPEPPRDVRVLEHKSRTAKISWSSPFNGNSAIIRYLVQCKSESGDWDSGIQNITTGSEETSITLRGLRPARTYYCRVRAENSVGLGDPSEPVTVVTTEEVPGGPPLDVKAEAVDSQSVRVTWRPPDVELWNGPIKGYYVGYKVFDSKDSYLYKTLEVGQGTREEVLLTQLQKFTSYSVLVQAYNSMGAGPRSDEVIVRTLEDVPGQAPSDVKCISPTSQSLHISWSAPPPFSIHGVLQGYKVLFRPAETLAGDEEYEERTISEQEIKLTNLHKFTNYTVIIMAFTQKGFGVRSDPIFCSTLEDVPGPPADIKAVVMSSDTILVSWKPPLHSNGLITKFTLYWRSLAVGAKYKWGKGEGKGEEPQTQKSFKTQGSAPVAPKQEDMIFTNSTHLVLHLSSWQGGGCSITRMSIEYRPHSHSHWTVLTDHVNPEQQHQLVVPDLAPETWYVVKVVAFNAAGSTTAEYDVITLTNTNAFPIPDHGTQGHMPSATSFFEDTTTLVSMASSGVVLIAGIVAVVCLVMYKRRRNSGHHYRESASRSDVATTTALMAHIDKKTGRSESNRHSHSHSHGHGHSTHNQQSHNNRDLPSYFSSPVRKVAPTNSVPQSRQNSQQAGPSTSHSSHSVPEYEDEIAPYATFQLPPPPGEEDIGETEEFKTFSVHHGEPPYLTKSSLDPPSSKSGKASEELYQSQAPNSHSLTSGSSNQEELLRAYEYARRHPPPPIQYDNSHNRGHSHTSGTGTTESEATDPGIRQFSGTPPKPNERRQGACLTPGTQTGASGQNTDSSTSDEATPVNTPHQARIIPTGFGALPRDRSRSSWGGQKGRSQSGAKKSSSKGIKKGQHPKRDK
ncbi:Down syndrome cell adhesion molecule-like [Argiope bruennichi]|uniref:Down syndrome cell adhesion molecule-like n=1 Tax=Argiope bruennichi TaxID=94029 RepID=A0A8T0EKD9_ARGBR|nr:Down syndrome cell adhesion molecule-like [Argiope bruennichi]